MVSRFLGFRFNGSFTSEYNRKGPNFIFLKHPGLLSIKLRTLNHPEVIYQTSFKATGYEELYVKDSSLI